MENWKDIFFIHSNVEYDYRGLYQVSNYGRIKSLRGKEKILKNKVDKLGYNRVTLCKNGKRKRFQVHRLVAFMFIPNNDLNKTIIDHIDTNPKNNHVSNLRWCTYSENNSNPLTKQKRTTPIALYNENDTLIKIYTSAKEAGDDTGNNSSHILACCKFYEMNCDLNVWFKSYKNYPFKSVGKFSDGTKMIWKYKKLAPTQASFLWIKIQFYK